MSKKLIGVFLAAVMVVTTVCTASIFASASETNFTQDFTSLKSTDKLPDGFTVAKWTATVGDGYVQLAAGSSLVLPESVKASDFTYEVKYTIASANESTRWAGFMFRYQSAQQYLQMCCRQNAAAAGGIDCAYNNNGSWSYPTNGKGSYSSSISADKVYTAKIVVNGSKAALFVNNKACVITTTLLDKEGMFGVQSNGSVVKIFGVKVSKTQTVPDKISDDSDQIKNVYEPSTKIAAAPTVVQSIDTVDKLDALNTEKARTQVARFEVTDQQLNVKVADKTYAISDIVDKCGTAVLPMFVVSDKDTAIALSQYITDNNMFDIIMASNSVEALDAAWNVNKYGIRYAYLAGALSETNTAAKIARDTHTACATIAIVDKNELLTRENAEYIQLRAIHVWQNAGTDSDKDMVYSAVDCGANGVTVKDFSAAYSLYEKVTKTKVIRRTFIIGHRGLPYAAPENSKESYQEAVKAGADAIECDVQITSDGVLISNHNGSVDGYTTDTDATGDISSFTWDQLSKYTLKAVGSYKTSQFCKMEWYFQILKDNPNVVGYVELKNTSDDVAKKTVELMESMGVQDQVFFICFSDSGLTSAKKYAPYAGTGRLGSGTYNVDASLQNNLATLMKTAGSTASSADLGFYDYTDEIVQTCRHRGIVYQTWTVDSLGEIVGESYIGISHITTNYANYSSEKQLQEYKLITGKLLFEADYGTTTTEPTATTTSSSSTMTTTNSTDTQPSSSTTISEDTTAEAIVSTTKDEPTEEQKDSPKTGDSSHSVTVFLVALSAVCGVWIILNKKYRRTAK